MILDAIAFVADDEDEFLDPSLDERVEDVLQNRPVASREHRLGSVPGQRAESRPFAGREDDCRMAAHTMSRRGSGLKLMGSTKRALAS
ncbi:hypothetical protein HLRTI_001126 [Halorhabdus tiamatea SARL4B]|uniref:Uncharacterized protein n=1 Tax=Halorhabdus tiamatea SARL4B TaxID=1033806 RepID=U2DMA0_9EURY|nr:hypothetical protein HLRTI_001126 [Halorhabdus tiamatea SARL4B]